jgi:ABC-type uncharacterized transport system permease subunit
MLNESLLSLLILVAIVSIILITLYLLFTLRRINEFLDETKIVVEDLKKSVAMVESVTEKAAPFIISGLTIFEGLKKGLENFLESKKKVNVKKNKNK